MGGRPLSHNAQPMRARSRDWCGAMRSEPFAQGCAEQQECYWLLWRSAHYESAPPDERSEAVVIASTWARDLKCDFHFPRHSKIIGNKCAAHYVESTGLVLGTRYTKTSCIVYRVSCIVYRVPCIVYCVPCIVYCVLCIVYCVLCIDTYTIILGLQLSTLLCHYFDLNYYCKYRSIS